MSSGRLIAKMSTLQIRLEKDKIENLTFSGSKEFCTPVCQIENLTPNIFAVFIRQDREPYSFLAL